MLWKASIDRHINSRIPDIYVHPNFTNANSIFSCYRLSQTLAITTKNPNNQTATSIIHQYFLETWEIVYEVYSIGYFKSFYMSKSSEVSTKKIASFEPRERAMDTQVKVCRVKNRSFFKDIKTLFDIEWFSWSG